MANLKDKLSDRQLLVELFALANLAFLSLDVFIAHSANAFHHAGEWIPVYFAALGSVVFIAVLVRARFDLSAASVRVTGTVVGWLSIAVGIVGLFFHLNSFFFTKLTIKSLVYTAPFAAPLAFAGLGFLLLLNRKVAADSVEWGKWVIFLALGGFVGNFVLALCDHAQNGFFHLTEWLPVCSSALVTGYLLVVLLAQVDAAFLKQCFWLIGLQVVVGLAGLIFHLNADFGSRAAGDLMDSLLYGAPVFAPLLLPNLGILATFGIWDVLEKSKAGIRQEA